MKILNILQNGFQIKERGCYNMENKKKTTFLMVKVDPEFKKKIKTFAQKKGLSESALIRYVLIKEMEEK